MSEIIQDFISVEKLLLQFSQFRPTERKPTWMEICSYPHHRLEEICSRILQFFLTPSNPHGVKNLFIKSLIQTIQEKSASEMQCPQDKNENTFLNISNLISVEREAGTENEKRIDLLIYSDSWVICIENKIFADDKYNPFKEYEEYVRKRFNHISEDKLYFILLSLKNREKCNEIWLNIYYQDLFDSIRKNIGDYLQNADSNYLSFFMDWMKTLEFKQNGKENLPMGNFTEDEIKFFSDDDNAAKIDKLIARKQEFDTNHRNAFIGMRESIKTSLNETFKDMVNPWDWQDVLAVDFKNKPGNPFVDIHARNGKCQIEFATREWLKKQDLYEPSMVSFAQKLNKQRNPYERIVLEKCELQENIVEEKVLYWVERLLQITNV